ncbi:kinase domain protein (macronuclear) [Tetrahymena thermophila SB210]|uniref:Kinase domain protein n=1 Tax=Tetrahymena thermophila (strain SB210) TaxID=312017 RepID=W7XA94_TETTS|nr:kinase domain protein [Tetrahymena thermophila SB210]EWS76290.1 kinase domain protein [Tetrahymena thermophila SB210]|eukprot:XP_012651074.1 kinase domain protein [Tetrahymena thermophila SB210]
MDEQERQNYLQFYEFNKQTKESLLQSSLIDEEQFEKCIQFMREKDIFIFNFIGNSNYSQIYLAYSVATQRYVSVKIIQTFTKIIQDYIAKPLTSHKSDKIIEDYLSSFEKIKNVLQIQSINYFEELQSIFFVQELGINTLDTYLQARKKFNKQLSKKEVYMICYQLFDGLREVHDKFQDVLLDKIDLCKIILTSHGDEVKYDYERYSNQIQKVQRQQKNNAENKVDFLEDMQNYDMRKLAVVFIKLTTNSTLEVEESLLNDIEYLQKQVFNLQYETFNKHVILPMLGLCKKVPNASLQKMQKRLQKIINAKGMSIYQSSQILKLNNIDSKIEDMIVGQEKHIQRVIKADPKSQTFTKLDMFFEFKQIDQLQSLRLDLKEPYILKQKAQRVQYNLQKAQNLTDLKLGLSNKQIFQSRVENISKVIQSCPSILSLYLDLQGNGVGVHSICELAKCFQLSPKLNVLTFNINGSYIGKEGTRILGEGLGNCSNLQHLFLYLSGMYIDEDDVKNIINGVQKLNLEELMIDLSFNQIDQVGMRTIKKFIKEASTLKGFQINFQDNYLGNLGINELCEGIKENKIIEYYCLDISDNKINDEGFLQLILALKECQQINNLTLTMKSNKLSNKYIELFIMLCHHLQNLNSLYLDLRINKIEDSDLLIVQKNLKEIVKNLIIMKHKH